MEGLEQKLKEINDELTLCHHAAEQANYIAGLASIRISELWSQRITLLRQTGTQTNFVKNPTEIAKGREARHEPSRSKTPYSADASLLKLTKKNEETNGGERK